MPSRAVNLFTNACLKTAIFVLTWNPGHRNTFCSWFFEQQFHEKVYIDIQSKYKTARIMRYWLRKLTEEFDHVNVFQLFSKTCEISDVIVYSALCTQNDVFNRSRAFEFASLRTTILTILCRWKNSSQSSGHVDLRFTRRLNCDVNGLNATIRKHIALKRPSIVAALFLLVFLFSRAQPFIQRRYIISSLRRKKKGNINDVSRLHALQINEP